MATLYTNHVRGTIAAIGSGDTTITSTAFSALPTISSPDIAYITLDPDSTAGSPEIVKVTAHTAASTSVTVERGAQSTTARAHLVSTEAAHGVTALDLDSFLVGVPDGSVTTLKVADDAITQAKMADAAVGLDQLAVGHVPYWTADAGSTASGTDTKILFSGTAYGETGWQSTESGGTRITPDVAGMYLVVLSASADTSAAGLVGVAIGRNGLMRSRATAVGSSSFPEGVTTTTVLPMNGSSDYVEGFYTGSTAASDDADFSVILIAKT